MSDLKPWSKNWEFSVDNYKNPFEGRQLFFFSFISQFKVDYLAKNTKRNLRYVKLLISWTKSKRTQAVRDRFSQPKKSPPPELMSHRRKIQKESGNRFSPPKKSPPPTWSVTHGRKTKKRPKRNLVCNMNQDSYFPAKTPSRTDEPWQKIQKKLKIIPEIRGCFFLAERSSKQFKWGSLLFCISNCLKCVEIVCFSKL